MTETLVPARAPRTRRVADADTAPPVTRHLLSRAREPEYVRALVAGYLVPHTMRLAPDAVLDAHLRCLRQGTISAYTLAYGAPVELRIDPSARAYLVLLDAADRIRPTGGSVTVDGRTVPLTPAVVTPGVPAVIRIPKAASLTVIRIPKKMIDTAARARRGSPDPGPIAFEPHMDPSSDHAGPWLTLARTFVHTAASGRIGESPLAMAHFEQLLVYGLLAAQPNSTRRHTDPARALPPGLRNALAYCDRYVGTPPSVAEIAAAAHVSQRTLQSYFRVYLGVTPQAHLREVQLRRVHDDLVAAWADGRRVTVTAIALRHGFQHLGRFAIRYRAMYGRSPSETLRRGPGV